MSFQLTTQELRQRLEDFLRSRAEVQLNADWPDLFRTIRLVDCDGPEAAALFAYDTLPWMTNILGIVHGGVTATLLDSCMGIASGAHIGKAAPTITMTVNYIKPVPLNTTVHVRARVLSVGGTTAHVMAEVFLPEQPDFVMASATGVYSPAAGIAW